MRGHLTTNDKIQAVLDAAVRGNADANVGETATGPAQEEYQRGRRLARLYGTNQGARLIKKRTKKRQATALPPVAGGPSTPSGSLLADGQVGGARFGGPHSGSVSAMASFNSSAFAASAGGLSGGMGPGMGSSSSASVIANPIDVDLRVPSSYRDVVEPHHPWYCGYRNSTEKGPAANVFANASRYGFNGSMRQTLKERPQTTLEQAPPKFLRAVVRRDEWTPKQSGTPVLWKEDSAYPTGVKLKHRNTHVVYGPKHRKREVDGMPWEKLKAKEERRFARLERAFKHEEAEAARLKEAADREKTGPWGGSVRFGGSSVLSAGGSIVSGGGSMMSQRSGFSARSALGVGGGGSSSTSLGGGGGKHDRRLKYWSSLTMVCSDEQNPAAAAEKLEQEKADRLMRYQLKWKELKCLDKILRASRKPNNEDLDDLGDLLYKTASENPVMTALSRDQFSKIMFNAHGTHAKMTTKHTHRLFSAFDPQRHDRADVRELLATLRVLRRPSESIEDKLREIFSLYDVHERGTATLVDLRKMFLTCVASDDDKLEVLKRFNEHTEFLVQAGRNSISLDDFEEMLGSPRSSLVQCMHNQLQAILAFTAL